MMQSRILLIEDSIESQLIVQRALGFKYQVETASSVEEARIKINSRSYALILMDVMLPDGQGFDLCREVRDQLESTSTPVVFLTGKNSISDKYAGFSLGADDYVTKPFDTAELLIRVDSLILRAQRRRYFSENITKGPIRLEVQNMSVFLNVDGEERQISMTPIEFKLLLKFVQSHQIVLTRQQLLDSIWGNDVFIEDRSIDKHICTIRKKIQPYDHSIKTVSGVGYKFQI